MGGDYPNVIELRPDEDPHGSALGRDLAEVIQTHMDRGNLTYSAIIGILVCRALDVYDQSREDT